MARLDDRPPSYLADASIRPKGHVQFSEDPSQINLVLQRKRSVLLDSVNPILQPNAFRRRKRPVRDTVSMPTASISGNKEDGSTMASDGDIQTRQYWKQQSNPYRE